jgi:protein TonB
MKHIISPTTLAVAAAAMVASAALLTSNTLAAEESPGTPAAVTCAVPDSNAKPISLAEADWPSVAQQMHLTGTAYVRVNLDSSGALSQADIARSSGTGVLDAAAIAAVQNSTFRPAIINCSPAGGTYIIVVDFPGNQ